jgi:ribonucleoside-diphosphate reductase alpha chain
MPSIRNEINGRELLSDAKFYESYSRYIDSEKRYETWDESVERVIGMHRTKYSYAMTNKLDEYISKSERAYKEKRFLGAQRVLQFGGDQILAHNIRLYNCLDRGTEFVTNHGMRSFNDYEDGDTVTVMTHDGSWKNAVVRSYGEASLNELVFKKGSNLKSVLATSNHRWMLKDGTVTDDVKVGNLIYKEPQVFGEFDFDNASIEEKLYWCYGFVFGDGAVNGSHSLCRLCGDKAKFEKRFTDLGFKSSSSASLSGDVIVYTGRYNKDVPDPTNDSPELIRAFVAGYLQADGRKNNNPSGKQYIGIQATGEKSINFIRECFPIAGVHIISEKDLTGEVTNYGTRGHTVNFTTCDHSGSSYNTGWKLDSIEENVKNDTVWCLEVEDNKTFVLSSGIVTGNCVSSHANRPKFFQEFMYMLLCGAGAGFSVQKHHVAMLPKIKNRTKKAAKIYKVDDSIEGWSYAFGVLLSSYFQVDNFHDEYKGHKVFFDLSEIRPKGAFISGGFKAPGPEPLRKALDKVEALLNKALGDRGGNAKLKPIEVYDVCMHMADAVISGGVRRSATIALFSHDDLEMCKAKTGNWMVENKQRSRSNNSAVLLRSEVDRGTYNQFFEWIKQFGEPAFVLVDSLEFTFNPCVEIGKKPVTEDGRSGWQGCNLTEINGAMCKTKEDFFLACEVSAVIGTVQAGYTDFKLLGEESKEIFEREALIGCSITGWMNNPDILFDEEILKEGAEIIKRVNKEVAAIIGIRPAARTTCAKPAGNSSVLLQTASGVHGEHAPRYLRYAQFNKDTEVAQLLVKHFPEMIEESVYSENKTDYAIAFPIIAPEKSIYKSDLYGVKQLEYVKKAQLHWVENGTNVELCVDSRLRHNVSNTISVDDWDAVADYVWENKDIFAGISFLGMSGDKDYAQAPNTKVLTEQELLDTYGTASFFASGLIVDGLHAFDNNLYLACNTVKGIGLDLKESGEDHVKHALCVDWVRRFHKFSNNYFEDDIKITMDCIKDVYLFHKWNKIQNCLRDNNIDWKTDLTEKQFVDIDTMGAVACAGGVCEI